MRPDAQTPVCLAALAIAACPLVTACLSAEPVTADSDVARPAGASAGLVERGEFSQTLLLTGDLHAVAGERIIVPRLPSWETTIRWMVEDGSVVREGDRLVELDTAQIASQLDDKETALEQAINELARKQAEVAGSLVEKEAAVATAALALRKAEIEAAIPLDLRAAKEHEEAQLALEQVRIAHTKAETEMLSYRESSEAELEVLRIDVRSAERGVEESRRAIDNMVLRAPRDGIAVSAQNRREDRRFQVGDTAWVGVTVMEIPDLSTMMVVARLSDVDDGKVKPGIRTSAVLDAYPNRSFPGRIRSISPVAQEANRRSMQRHFEVIVDLDGSDPEVMRPGMSAKIEARTRHESEVLLVPRSALELDGGRAFAVLPDGRREPVDLGPCNAHECVLESGPAEGTRLRSRR